MVVGAPRAGFGAHPRTGDGILTGDVHQGGRSAVSDIEAAVDDVFPWVRRRLEELVRIPSVSAPGFDPAPVRSSAEATARLLDEAGFGEVGLLEVAGAHPAVYGHLPGPPGAPTVLLYAHHDVQPAGPESEWTTPPFQPVERDGRLYGRGSADDKSGIVTHAATARLVRDEAPVTMKVFVEGEEEIGSANLDAFLAEHGDLLASDVVVVADSTNWRAGVPAITGSLRGLVSARVDVEVLENGVHSGMFGGPVPDALTVMCRVLATLHDVTGSVAVPGLVATDTDPLDLTEEELRRQAGVLPGVELIGEGTLTSRLWTRPAAAVLAIDAPPVAEAINQLVPRASAKVSLRLAPGDEPTRAMAALLDHLSTAAPWGARVTVTPLESGRPYALPGSDSRVEAFREAMRDVWGLPPVDMGVGGSIPLVAALADRLPGAAIVLVGAGDPTSAMHGPNESVDLADLRRSIIAQVLALEGVARSA
jgi:cysteinylglycine-S-conjugate dipeptidase